MPVQPILANSAAEGILWLIIIVVYVILQIAGAVKKQGGPGRRPPPGPEDEAPEPSLEGELKELFERLARGADPEPAPRPQPPPVSAPPPVAAPPPPPRRPQPHPAQPQPRRTQPAPQARPQRGPEPQRPREPRKTAMAEALERRTAEAARRTAGRTIHGVNQSRALGNLDVGLRLSMPMMRMNMSHQTSGVVSAYRPKFRSVDDVRRAIVSQIVLAPPPSLPGAQS